MTLENQDHTDVPEDGLTLKDLILKAKRFTGYLLSFWKLYLVVIVIGIALGYYYASTKKPAYSGTLIFVLEDSKSSGGGLGAYSGIASQFGIDLGGSGASAGLFQGDNIIELLKTRLLIQKALLTAYPGDSTKSLADILVDISGLRKKWDKNDRMKKMHFPVNYGDAGARTTLIQDSALGVLREYLLKSNSLVIAKIDKKLSFIKATCTTDNELFSKFFVENLVKEATGFYVTLKTKRSKANVDNLQRKNDSLLQVLNQKTFSIAQAQDLNPNPARRLATVGSEINARDKMIAQTLYAEVVKNLEISKMSLAQEMPLIQIVDTPILPLTREATSKMKYALIFAFFGVVITVAFLVTRRMYYSALKA